MAWKLSCSADHVFEIAESDARYGVATCPKCGELVMLPSEPHVVIRAELPPPRDSEFDSHDETAASRGRSWHTFSRLSLLLLVAVVGVGLVWYSTHKDQPADPQEAAETPPNVHAPNIVAHNSRTERNYVTPEEALNPAAATEPAAKVELRPLAGSSALNLGNLTVESIDNGVVRITYRIENTSGKRLSVNVRDGDYFLGRRTHLIERLGTESRIKSMEKESDLQGKKYVLSTRPTWSDPVIGAHQVFDYAILVDASAFEKGTYRWSVQFRAPDNSAVAELEEASVDFDWAGPPAVATTNPVPVAPAPAVVAPIPAPVEPPPRVANRLSREAEIEQAWKDAEIDTLDQKAIARDRMILKMMRSGVESILRTRNVVDTTRVQQNNGGSQILNIYSLLHAGQAIEDPRLRFNSSEMEEPVKTMAQLDTDWTYTAALQASALSMLPQRQEYLAALKRSQKYLLAPSNGAYTYQLPTNLDAEPRADFSPRGINARARRQDFDHSNTQYANLGVWALYDAGLEVTNSYWSITDNHWRQTQCRDGGWDYNGGIGNSTPTMTEAGLASLLTASYATMSNESPFRDNTIIRGLRSLEGHLSQSTRSSIYTMHNGYGLYGIERVGLASGLKRIGKHDWYDEGIHNIQNTPNAFQLLFLTRGRNPVAMNKLQYDGKWDAHPWDVANLTRWLSKSFERPMIWQIVSAKDPIDDWMDAPILLITGDKPFPITTELLTKLQTYVDAGGLIYSTSTSDSEAFTSFIKTLSSQLSRKQYEMRKLTKDDPFFSLYHKVANPPEIWAMSNGVREIWIHASKDMAMDWQRYATAQSASWDTPVQVYLYVNGKSPMKRRVLLTDPRTAIAAAPRKIVVGRLNYAGNWNPEPGAWPLYNLWLSQYGISLTIKEVTPANLNTIKPDLLAITGTANFQPTDPLQKSLATYIDGGGVILADAAGGRSEFTESFMKLMQDTLTPISMNDPFYSFKLEGGTLGEKIEYRRSWILQHGQFSEARIRGAKSKGDRFSVFFSPDDITSGFLGTNTWGVQGYTPETARQIVRAILEQTMNK